MAQSAPSDFGERLRRHRLANGISQKELAERADLSPNAIGALESGRRRAPYRETVTVLADALGLAGAERRAFEDAAAGARARGTKDGDANAAALHELPTAISSFIGRDAERQTVRALLSEARLVTLTGVGGVGKSRLAIEAARLLGDAPREGVRLVDCASIGDAGRVAASIAAMVRIPFDARRPVDALVREFASRELLFIADNCDHLLAETGAVVRQLLHSCPRLAILCTSRERLGITGERIVRVSGFASSRPPASVAEAHDHDGMMLFAARVAAIDAHFTLRDENIALVHEICASLDGIPLFIELAAATTPALGLRTLRNLLASGNYRVLSGGGRDLPPRQHDLSSTNAWSYDRLDARQQRLFRRASIFVQGWPYGALGAVCGDDELAPSIVPLVMSSLVDTSLVTATTAHDDVTRMTIPQTTRSFGMERLIELGEDTVARARHAQWVLELARDADDAYWRTTRESWLDRYAPESGNARAAIEWYLGRGADAVGAGTIVGALHGVWATLGVASECATWARTALERIDVARHPAVAARLLRALAACSDGRTRVEAGRRAVDAFSSLADERGLAESLALLARGLTDIGDPDAADETLRRADEIVRGARIEGSFVQARVLVERCALLRRRGTHVALEAIARETSALATAHGDAWIALAVATLLAGAAADAGDVPRARSIATDALERARAKKWRVPEMHLSNALAAHAVERSEHDVAETHARDAFALACGHASAGFYHAVETLAAVAASRGKVMRAARLIGAVDAWCEREAWSRGRLERASRDRLDALVRARLSPESLRTFAASGAQMSDAQVAREAAET